MDRGDCFGLDSKCSDEYIDKLIRRTTGEVSVQSEVSVIKVWCWVWCRVCFVNYGFSPWVLGSLRHQYMFLSLLMILLSCLCTGLA